MRIEIVAELPVTSRRGCAHVHCWDDATTEFLVQLGRRVDDLATCLRHEHELRALETA